MAVSEARERASHGDLGAACACLLFGLHRMEELLTGGDAWAEDLLDAYQDAAKSYAPPPAPPAGTSRVA